MLMNNIAIVGIDAQFGDYATIDRVARALYLGKVHLGKTHFKASDLVSTKPLSLNKLIDDSSQRMLSQLSATPTVNQELKDSNLSVIVVTDNIVDAASDNPVKKNKTAFDLQNKQSIIVVDELSEALTLATELTDKKCLVAIIGLSLNTAENVNGTEVNDTDINNTDINDTDINNTDINNTISFDQSFTCYQTVSGFASFLLCSKQIAEDKNLPIYAQIDSMAVSKVNAIAMQEAVKQSLAEVATQHTGANIGLVEVSALGHNPHTDVDLSELEAGVLLNSYPLEPTTNELNHTMTTSLTRAISCARSVTGEGGRFSQVLGLLRTVIALQQRYIPGINDWQSVKALYSLEPANHLANHLVKNSDAKSSATKSTLCNWQSSAFYFPTTARPWYPNSDASKHSAAYSCLTANSYCHIVLSEYVENKSSEQVAVRYNGHLANSDLRLLLVNGDNEAELQQTLTNLLAKLLTRNANLKLMADQQYQQYRVSSNKTYTLALLAESIEELQKEIQLAQAGIKAAFESLLTKQVPSKSSTQWKTPKGSYFTADTLAKGQDNNVCFMYPGIGATYLGLGSDLLQLFPEIYPQIVNLADDIGSSLKDLLINPRSINRLNFNELKQRDLALRGNLADIAEAGVAFSCVFTKVLTEVFKLKADFATGYSMGEVSMYAALGCWQKPSLLTDRLANSKTFNERLSGDLLTLREQWNLPEKNIDNNANTVWETYTIKATLAEVEAEITDEDRVFCTIINTPEQLLIGGYPEDCLRVINKLGVRAMPLNMANAIHSEPAITEYNNMVDLYTMAVNQRSSTKLYSSSCYLPVPQLSKAIANSIAKCLCDRVDFPRLVNALYDNGARVFIEMGAGRSLSGWVEKVLEQKGQSVTVPVNAKGVSDELTYYRAIAKLVSHGITLDLTSLFYGTMIISARN
ncbi:PfaB family protein [Colwellia echini]|uniref:PfaB family protein n=1 Tax=Colwellia echini TaxID=1982103 RepID=A0ABY3MV13_9GAMM|nr:PfaB family protein [Colwellia echini]TYK64932.1 PfaB family protein [Colwellia echini]